MLEQAVREYIDADGLLPAAIVLGPDVVGTVPMDIFMIRSSMMSRFHISVMPLQTALDLHTRARVVEEEAVHDEEGQT